MRPLLSSFSRTNEPKQMSKWTLQRFRVEMELVTCRRREKKKERNWVKHVNIGRGADFGRGGKTMGAMHCRGWERGWVTLLEMWVIVEYVRLPLANWRNSIPLPRRWKIRICLAQLSYFFFFFFFEKRLEMNGLLHS